MKQIVGDVSLVSHVCFAGKPSRAKVVSSPYSYSTHTYNLTAVVDSVSPVIEVRFIYRRIMVSNHHLVFAHNVRPTKFAFMLKQSGNQWLAYFKRKKYFNINQVCVVLINHAHHCTPY